MWPWRRSDPAALPKPGDVIAGKYRVERVLGVGGMGVVIAARHTKLDEVVALKLLRPTAARTRDDIVRFLREGKAASKLKSEHVVRILDLGELPGEVPYLVMEHLEGRDFAMVLHEHASMRAKLPIAHVVESVLEACEAVAEAHTLGIVHRDLKPANLFLAKTPSGGSRVKVLDFGISKLTRDEPGADLSLTQTRTLMGSPIYMSPEVLRSARAADARADVWAFGCILYELLTGQTPFRGETLPELTAQILEELPRPPSGFRDDIPWELDEIVLRCLEKKPDARYANAAELARALAKLAGARGAQAIERLERIVRAAEVRARSGPEAESSGPVLALEKAAGDTTLRGWGTTRVSPGRSRRTVVVAAIASGVVGLVGLGVYLAEHRSTALATAPASAAAKSAPEPAPPAPKAVESSVPEELAPQIVASASASPPQVASAKPVVKAPAPKKKTISGPSAVFDDPN